MTISLLSGRIKINLDNRKELMIYEADIKTATFR